MSRRLLAMPLKEVPMSLRVVAIAAPERPEGGLGKGVLNSTDPASLFNACRYAAFLAERHQGPWGESNWTEGRHKRRSTCLLMHSLREDAPIFEQLLQHVQPNLLLVGAMSLSLPGAIACCRKAKEIFGD